MVLAETGNAIQFMRTRNELFANLYRNYSKRIADAMTKIPRDKFVDPSLVAHSFEDRPIPIRGHEFFSSISQPTVVATMTELLDPQKEDVVLEIGTATGYQAAILGQLSKQVYTVESIPDLAIEAEKRLRALDTQNVQVIIADGSARFTPPETVDKLLITASVFPSPLVSIFESLKIGGTCVCPIGGVDGEYSECDLVKMHKTEHGLKIDETFPGYSFVPMGGANGWGANINGFIESANQYFYNKLGYTRKPSSL